MLRSPQPIEHCCPATAYQRPTCRPALGPCPVPQYAGCCGHEAPGCRQFDTGDGKLPRDLLLLILPQSTLCDAAARPITSALVCCGTPVKTTWGPQSRTENRHSPCNRCWVTVAKTPRGPVTHHVMLRKPSRTAELSHACQAVPSCAAGFWILDLCKNKFKLIHSPLRRHWKRCCQ